MFAVRLANPEKYRYFSHAIHEYTKGQTDPSAAIPEQMWVETWLPETLAELQAGANGASFFSMPASAAGGSATASLNYTAAKPSTAPFGSVMYETTVWPTWPKGGDGAAVGILARASASGAGIFAGVTSDHKLVLEEWKGGSAAPKTLGSFDLATLPDNQNKAAVNGWNMLRLCIASMPMETGQADGTYADVADVWFNPTHADPAGPLRGRRLQVQLPVGAIKGAGDGLMAASRGGAALKLDYAGVYGYTPHAAL